VAIKIALPKGRLLRKTSALLQKAEWGLDEYHSKMGFYHPQSQRFPDLRIKVFHEKDIPIQVAVGNYDLGICSLDWIEELLAKYPDSAVVKVKDLMYGEGTLYVAAASSPSELGRNGSPVRIASEYPNLAEAFALRSRLSRFSVFPVWGAAEAYPPESAEMALLAARNAGEIAAGGLAPLSVLCDCSAFLIANRASWETKNMNEVVTSICDGLDAAEKKQVAAREITGEAPPVRGASGEDKDTVKLALPDGHQQQPMLAILNRGGIEIEDYPSETGNRRPRIGLEGVSVKVIRPQDMPLQVANGNFDLAITGRDWLTEHLNQFPTSPVREMLNIGSGRVRMVAVVSRELPVDDAAGLREYLAGREETFRVASEYVNIADKYAREKRLGRYRVIPTWGATEAFLPEDADMLIENTETGRTIARHNLKIIDTLFESTACLVGREGEAVSPLKKRRMQAVIDKLELAVEEG
jgi:ATP phosphoribosyltransferase